MWARITGKKPNAPPPASNGTKRQFSQKNLNNATGNLQTALNKIASQHVLKYANAIRKSAIADANAARAKAVAVETPTQTNVTNAVRTANIAAEANKRVEQTEKVTEQALAMVPQTEPASGPVVEAEANAVNAVIKNIQSINKPLSINAIKNSKTYTKGSNNNRRKINAAINARKYSANPFAK